MSNIIVLCYTGVNWCQLFLSHTLQQTFVHYLKQTAVLYKVACSLKAAYQMELLRFAYRKIRKVLRPHWAVGWAGDSRGERGGIGISYLKPFQVNFPGLERQCIKRSELIQIILNYCITLQIIDSFIFIRGLLGSLGQMSPQNIWYLITNNHEIKCNFCTTLLLPVWNSQITTCY